MTEIPEPGVVLLFGAPGAGKGTQARRIQQRLGLPLIATGDLIRAEVWAGTPTGESVRETLRAGELVEDGIVNALLERALRQTRHSRGFLLDGYPRTPPQARRLAELAAGLGLRLAVIDIQVSYNDLKRRVTGRRICPHCGAIFHIHSKPPATEDVCDGCGAGLIRRSDDREEAVAARWRAYEQQTRPVLEVLRASGYPIHAVDGTLPPEDVTRAVLRLLCRP